MNHNRRLVFAAATVCSIGIGATTPIIVEHAFERYHTARGRLVCPRTRRHVTTTVDDGPDAILAVRSADPEACLVDYGCRCGNTHRYWFDASEMHDEVGPSYVGDVDEPGALPSIPAVDDDWGDLT